MAIAYILTALLPSVGLALRLTIAVQQSASIFHASPTSSGRKMMPNTKIFPNNWPEIAPTRVKENAGWCCACSRQCLRLGDDTKRLTKSEYTNLTLTVHHYNRMPFDNRSNNSIAVCTTTSFIPRRVNLMYFPRLCYRALSTVISIT